MMDFSNHKFRASSIGKIMTNDRSGKKMGETCKKYLREIYIKEKYKREREITSKYITKGLEVEDDSMTLYCRVVKTFHVKNEDRFENEFVCGTPDIIHGETIIDIKSSWSIYTFFDVVGEEINAAYRYQLQTYMALTGAFNAKLCYCLVNTPEPLINDEKRRLMWNMGVTSSENPLYLQACEELDKSMRFDDIPLDERIIEFNLDRDDELISRIYERIIECREFLNKISLKEVTV